MSPLFFNATNLNTLDPNVATDPTEREELYIHKYTALQLIQAQSLMAIQLTLVQNAMNGIVQSILNLKNQTNSVLNGVVALPTLLNPLFGYVDTLESLATCGFLGTAYLNFKIAYCEGVVGALSYLALASFFIALFGLPVIILSIVLKKRLPNPFAADPFSPSKSKKGRFSGGEASDLPMQQTTNGTYGYTNNGS